MMYNPCSISHDQWCKQVKKIVYQSERYVWTVRKGMYKKTVILNYCITNIEMWCWCEVSSLAPSIGYMVRLVLRLISKEYSVACNTTRWTRVTTICKLCDVYTTESVWHFLFACMNVGVVRDERLKTIYGVMPTPMQRYLTSLTSKEKACFLLSGMKCTFTQEWQNIYCAILSFTYKMYNVRKSLNSY